MGERQITMFGWLKGASVLRVIMDPRNVTFDEPVVLQFNEKGDQVPLTTR